ncbi:anti-sigma factor [Marivirga lumbricoides]|uniref:Anti-sigma factor n=1 Tax=Marivirga lumbricoides TaxID=1046115 RepID=A0ABQ1MG54_9BACT|nr:anti-sigma factor [Marivirga lumbricoides]
MENPENNIDDALLAKYLDGSTSSQENEHIELWLAKSLENKKLFDQFKEIWFQSEAAKYNTDLDFNEKAAFKSVLSRIEEKDSSAQESIAKSRSLLPSWFTRIAAILVIGIGIYFVYNNLQSSKSEVLVSAIKESTEITLPDSSVVNLNIQSKLVYNNDFKHNRNLSLSGEAFFEVEKKENLPFIIQAGKLEVKVVGTSFYIIARENDNFIEVGVKSGIVEVKEKASGELITLKKGESLTYNKNSQSFKRSESFSNNQLFWKTGVLEFDNQPLNQVFLALEKAYEKEIIYQETEVKNCIFTGRFKNATLKEIIDQLQISFNIEASMGEKVVIRGKGCEE